MATVVQRINSTAQSAGLGFYVSASNNNPASNELTIHSSQGNSLALANGTTPPSLPAPPAPPVISNWSPSIVTINKREEATHWVASSHIASCCWTL